MRDPCRVCGVRMAGSQCRWIFSSTGSRKLQVVLSHVLGREVARDGRSEFLCGKCVFQLEKVVQLDVEMGRLLEEHGAQLQKLQAQKDHLAQCIAHVYTRNNPAGERGGGDGGGQSRIALRRSSGGGSPEEGQGLAGGQHTLERQQQREAGWLSGGRVRRCASLDILGGTGEAHGRSTPRKHSGFGAGTPSEPPVKNPGFRSAKLRSKSMYLDLVQRKVTRSTSLQSLNPDLAPDPPAGAPASSDPPARRQQRKSKVWRLEEKAPSSETPTRPPPGGPSPGKLPKPRPGPPPPSQPSVTAELLHLLRSIPRRPVKAPPESRLPQLRRLTAGAAPPSGRLTPGPGARRRHREAEWKSLHDLTEEFNDDYAPLKAEVAVRCTRRTKIFRRIEVAVD
ncbi:protein SPT2 homolog [Hypomesus transpacificus]|uniref:protein SPT2 homolog n=1 Tax=Hypomesus transpacificus TaxID=137520 RepID=UPI001F079F56|nr:protein SPT2 homolog [Hypomesus transpacificus]